MTETATDTTDAWYRGGYSNGYEWRNYGLVACARELAKRTKPFGHEDSFLRGSPFAEGWLAGMAQAISELVNEP